MGSVFGAFVAAVIIAMVKAFCIGAGSIDLFGTPFPLSKLTLVAEFLVMAIVLVWRPWGLFGKPQGVVRGAAALETPLRPLPAIWKRWGYVALAALLLVPLLQGPAPYVVVLMIDLLIAVLFAASLHFVMGPAGMHSFGHAAYFGLGAYGAALWALRCRWRRRCCLDAVGAGRRCVRLVRVRSPGISRCDLAFGRSLVDQYVGPLAGAERLTASGRRKADAKRV